ncbi:MAG: hypothetical protein PVF89_07060 [Lysobacterales bacterium]|jgi:hypothetical protein
MKLDASTQYRLRKFFEDYRVLTIRLHASSDIRNNEICEVDIGFGSEADATASAYQVSFKLLGSASDSHRYLEAVEFGPEPARVRLTAAGEEVGGDAIAGKVRALLDAIESRVAKVHREQSIMGIQPVGETFLLNNKTRFKVISDDGEGHLRIELLDRDGDNTASLLANDLLDGLYVGLITRA